MPSARACRVESRGRGSAAGTCGLGPPPLTELGLVRRQPKWEAGGKPETAPRWCLRSGPAGSAVSGVPAAQGSRGHSPLAAGVPALSKRVVRPAGALLRKASPAFSPHSDTFQPDEGALGEPWLQAPPRPLPDPGCRPRGDRLCGGPLRLRRPRSGVLKASRGRSARPGAPRAGKTGSEAGGWPAWRAFWKAPG